MKVFLLFLSLFSFLYCDGESGGFSYLQKLRTKAQMTPFTRNGLLDEASYNHSNYLKINNTGGHIEDTTKGGSTGAKPSDRTKHVGLLSKSVGENVSTGQTNFMESIDGLFTAIYHRLGFLNIEFDMVGLSKVNDRYTYVMSNTLLEDLCKNEPGENSGQLICANGKAFGSAKVNSLKKQTADKSPKVIIWPPNNSDDNPPYFYVESPDPLPNHDVSGNPISITFNKFTYSSPPTLNTFKLLDSEEKVVQTIFRSKANAVNQGFLDEYVFILFPEERLKWGSTYKIEYDFTSALGAIKGASTFKTRELKGKVYYVKDKDAELKVISGESYTIDLIPLNKNDDALSGGYSGGGTAQAGNLELISLNTFKVAISGNIGSYVDYQIDGGARSVKLVVSESDDVGDEGEDEDDNTGNKKEISYTKGWNLNALLDKTAISNMSNYFKNFTVVYTFNGTKFVLNPSSITYKDAYFVYYLEDTKTNVPFKENETYEIDIKTFKKDSWNLAPIGKDIDNVSDYFNGDMLYILRNSKYEKPSGAIKRGQALWVLPK